jgi:hypothetical protein
MSQDHPDIPRDHGSPGAPGMPEKIRGPGAYHRKFLPEVGLDSATDFGPIEVDYPEFRMQSAGNRGQEFFNLSFMASPEEDSVTGCQGPGLLPVSLKNRVLGMVTISRGIECLSIFSISVISLNSRE